MPKLRRRFNFTTVDISTRISNYIPQFYVDLIIDPCSNRHAALADRVKIQLGEWCDHGPTYNHNVLPKSTTKSASIVVACCNQASTRSWQALYKCPECESST